MPYIGRRPDRSIYGAWTSKQPMDADHLGLEEVPETDPEYLAFLIPPPPIDRSDTNNLERVLKALVLCIAQVGGLTVAQIRTLFKAKWDALP